MGIVVVGGMSGPEVVALDLLAALLEETGEPQLKCVGRVAGSTRWKYHSIMGLFLGHSVNFNRFYYLFAEYN